MLERQLQMPETLQKKMEHGMGYDFSKVEMGESQKVSKMGFHAYAKGNTILFAPGRFNPFTLRGQRLIGHELGHIVQNTRGRVNAEQEIEGEQVNVDTSYEKEADNLSAKATSLSESIEGNDLVTADASASSVVQGEGPEVRVTNGADKKGRRLGDGYDTAIATLRSWAAGEGTGGGNIHKLKGKRKNQWAIDVKGTGKGRGGGRLIFTRDAEGNIDVIDVVSNHNY